MGLKAVGKRAPFLILPLLFSAVALSAQAADRQPSPSGVIIYRPEAVQAGYNLLNDKGNEFHLIDMHGEILHTWRHRSSGQYQYARILPNGDLYAIGQRKFVHLNWNSEELYFARPNMHHEIALQTDGSFFTFGRVKVRYKGQTVKFDIIKKVLPDHSETLFWSSCDNLEALQQHHPLTNIDDPTIPKIAGDAENYYHFNSIQVLPANALEAADSRFRQGNLLVCARNVNLVFILDREERNIVWSWGPGELDLPHYPRMDADGKIHIYDNGYHRENSRIIRLNPQSLAIEWEYAPEGDSGFFNPTMGSCQLLPDGNILVTDSRHSHVFEVTPDKEKVWEFYSPNMYDRSFKKIENPERTIYRMERYAPGFIGAILEQHPD